MLLNYVKYNDSSGSRGSACDSECACGPAHSRLKLNANPIIVTFAPVSRWMLTFQPVARDHVTASTFVLFDRMVNFSTFRSSALLNFACYRGVKRCRSNRASVAGCMH